MWKRLEAWMWGEKSPRTFGHVKSENQVERSMRSSDMQVRKSEESLVWVPSRALEINESLRRVKREQGRQGESWGHREDHTEVQPPAIGLRRENLRED